MTQEYTVGFLFSKDGDEVLLIHKERPDWQRGLFQGIGGKVENNEQPVEAQQREFYEETGLIIPHWRHFLTLNDERNSFIVYFFLAYSDDLKLAMSKTDELVSIEKVRFLPSNIVSDLEWIIPMAKNMSSVKYYQVQRVNF